MSDSLRDRIARIVFSNTGQWQPTCNRIADAIISDLGLHREVQWAWNNNQSRETGHRYVTEWKVDQ